MGGRPAASPSEPAARHPHSRRRASARRASPRRAVVQGGAAGALSTLGALLGGRARAEVDFAFVAPEDTAALRARDRAIADSLEAIDLGAERRRQLDNLARRGTEAYDATCTVEASCREPPSSIGEAVGRLFSDINNSEIGFSSPEKMAQMGLDPSTRVNVR